MSLVLLFLGRDSPADGWLRLDEEERVERATAAAPLVLAPEDRLIAVAPGDSVTLRWLDLEAGLTPVQAAAAARLLLADQSAEPIAEMHVAVGREVAEEPGRSVALVPAAAMSEWLRSLEAVGLDPAAIVPEPLLLPVPDDGLVRYDRDGLSVFRAQSEGFAIEADTAELLVAGRPVAAIDRSLVERGLSALAGDPLLDLRQGPFARRRQVRLDPALVRRLATLTAALLLVTLAIQLASILRYTLGADALEAETRQVAAHALPRNPGVTNPSGELADRLVELRGGGAGYDATASALFDAIKATPNVELNGLSFSPDGSLRATLAADNQAVLEDIGRRVEASGFVAELGPPRSGGGRRVADLTVRPS